MSTPNTRGTTTTRGRRRARPLGALALAVALAAALSGCATPATPPADPAVPPVPAAWQAGGRAADGALPDAGWWARLGDPELPRLVQAAQAASVSVASAGARIERARAARVAAGAALLPQVDLTAAASRGRVTPLDPVAGSVSAGAQASWEIDLFGANAAARRGAQARLEIAQAQLHDARIAVAAETAATYTALRACEAQALTTRADADSRAETSRLTGLSAKAGLTAPADAALVRAGAAQSRSSWLAQRAQCENLVKALVELTDLAEPDLRQRLQPRSAQLPQPPALAVPALPAQLLAQRPDLFQAARALVAAAADRDRAGARELPQIGLTGSFARMRLNTLGESFSGNVWSFGPLTVSFPLFDGGARAAERSAAQAAYEEAQAQYRAAARRAVREVESSLVALEAAAARQTDVKQAVDDFEASLRATEARYKGGLASLFDLEAARRNALAARSALVDLQRETAAAWITLYRALGGGWNEAQQAAAGPP